MNELVTEWRNKAEADFATACREMNVAENANYDAVCFHAQQRVEKLLKAALLQDRVAAQKDPRFGPSRKATVKGLRILDVA